MAIECGETARRRDQLVDEWFDQNPKKPQVFHKLVRVERRCQEQRLMHRVSCTKCCA